MNFVGYTLLSKKQYSINVCIRIVLTSQNCPVNPALQWHVNPLTLSVQFRVLFSWHLLAFVLMYLHSLMFTSQNSPEKNPSQKNI